MIRLSKEKYHLLTGPLQAVTINNLFARSVVEGHVSGTVYADTEDDPRTFYIVHPYGMSLLLGDWRNPAFNTAFKEYALNRQQTRSGDEWMQAFPAEWDAVLAELFNDCLVEPAANTAGEENLIELNTRVNFQFNPARYAAFKQANPGTGLKIVRTDAPLFEAMKGSVVPRYFWNSAADFCTYGAGFSVFDGDRLASTAYSSTIHDRQLELGIETVAECRGKGFAQYACSALIDYCLANDYEPVWACRLENTGSYRLAQKLGFEHTLSIPYYRLSK